MEEAVVADAMRTHMLLRTTGETRKALATLDTAAEVNVISPLLVAELELTKSNVKEPRMHWGSGRHAFCHGAYKITWEATDSLGKTETREDLFYALEQEGAEVILGMPCMRAARIEINTAEYQWRFHPGPSPLSLISGVELAKEIEGVRHIFSL